jgi:hypothetical protein
VSAKALDQGSRHLQAKTSVLNPLATNIFHACVSRVLKFGLPKMEGRMFNSSVIDVAIGLVFVFLLLSLVASAVKEGLEAIFKRRASDLERGIRELVGDVGESKKTDANSGDDKDNSDKKAADEKLPAEMVAASFVGSLYDHGLINSLFAGKYGAKGTELPSYIPSKNFALALMDLQKKSQTDGTIVLPAHVKQAFDAFKITAGEDLDKMQKQIEDWYNSSMDRVSGWYKRRTQYWLLGIGIVLTVAVNVDCIAIAKRLSTDTTLREAVVKAAQQELKSNPIPSATQTSTTTAATSNSTPDESIKKVRTNLTALDGVGLPIGWGDDWKDWDDKTAKIGQDTGFVDRITIYRGAAWNLTVKNYPHFAGWLMTALAVSLGAPFWFDMLNKFMVVRSTVKPSEKSKEEGSKDAAATKTAAVPAK